MDLRQRLFQYRSFTPIPFLIAMIILAKPTLTSMLAGFFVVLAGESLRLRPTRQILPEFALRALRHFHRG